MMEVPNVDPDTIGACGVSAGTRAERGVPVADGGEDLLRWGDR